jgi:hypothetical protein
MQKTFLWENAGHGDHTEFEWITSILFEKNRKGVNVRTSHNLEARLPSN